MCFLVTVKAIMKKEKEDKYNVILMLSLHPDDWSFKFRWGNENIFIAINILFLSIIVARNISDNKKING